MSFANFSMASLAPPISRENSNRNKETFKAAPASSVIELRLAGKPSGSIFRQRAAVEAYRVEKDHEDKRSDEAV
jgi:hypothetical protein